MNLTFKDETSYNEEMGKHLMDKMEMFVDGEKIATLNFIHDKKDVEIEINENIRLDELEKIFAYRDSFTQISQMIFMDIGYHYFNMLSDENPEKAKKLADYFMSKSKEDGQKE